MSQTLDCEFVGKHFTTLCLHRAVGDPTSHYSALWSPEQIWRGWQEGERETECIFESEILGKIRKLFWNPEAGPSALLLLPSTTGMRKACSHWRRQKTYGTWMWPYARGKWLRDVMLIRTSVNDIHFSVHSSLGLPSSCQWLLWTTHQPHWNHEVGLHFPSLIKPFWAPQQWEWLAGSTTRFDHWSGFEEE